MVILLCHHRLHSKPIDYFSIEILITLVVINTNKNTICWVLITNSEILMFNWGIFLNTTNNNLRAFFFFSFFPHWDFRSDQIQLPPTIAEETEGREVEYMPKVIQLAAECVLEPRNPDYCFKNETPTSLAFLSVYTPWHKTKHESIMIRISPFDAHNSLNDSGVLGCADFPNS